MKLSVLIPAHNEEIVIEETIRNLSKHLKEKGVTHEILIVNDNSSDNTEKILIELEQEISELRHVNNTPPNGFGLAVKKGLENFDGDAVAIVMADGSDMPEDVLKYFNLIRDGYDCAFGSRFIKGSKTINYPWFKLVLNRIYNLMIRMLFGLQYNDITNAFKMYKANVIPGLMPLLSHHFNLTVELPLKAIIRGYSYTVVPISWKNRTGGESKLKLKEMGSRYAFIVIYCFIEKWLSRGDYKHDSSKQENVQN